MKTIILPGMGADSTMYPKKSYASLSGGTFAEWPSYDGENTIEAISGKIIKELKITEDFVVGGSSLGGMVAVQIAKFLNIKKVILIGSATHPKYVNPVLQKLSTIAEITPIKLIQLFAGKINIRGRSDLLTMFEKSESEFIRAMCKAIFKWDGIQEYQCEVCRIHGAADKVIFPPKNDVEIIKDGGHLISITHSELVSEFINKNSFISSQA